jgi:hypothetical protein
VQQTLARSVLALGKQYDAFSQSLQPEVIRAFNTMIHATGAILHDVQPVAKATGVAFDTFLGQFAATLQDPQWQQFWGFMAATAPQDMRLLGNLVIDLTNDLPPLVEGLQPVATGLLKVADDGAKAFGVIGKGITDLNHPNTSTGFWSGTLWDKLVGSAQALAGVLPHTSNSILGMAQRSGEASAKLGDLTHSSALANPPIVAMAQNLSGAAARAFGMKTAAGLAAAGTNTLGESFAGAAVHAFDAKQGLTGVAASSAAAAPKVTTFAHTVAGATAAAQGEKFAVDNLTTSLNKMITPILSLEGDQVSFRQAQQAATTAINANKKSLDGNSASALAARAAVIQSTQAAITFAGQEVTVHHNVKAASDILQAQITYLEKHAGKSKIAAAEIDALRRALNSLPARVRANVDIIGHGRGGISFNDQIAGQKKTGFLEFHAAGGMVGGPPGIDRTPIMASRGEVVVPTHMVAAGVVDHLRGLLPGFAAGGLVGGNTVLDRGIPYVSSVGASFEHTAMMQGTKALIAAAVQAAKAAARAVASFGNILGGPGGGAPGANAALARRLFPQWGSGAEWGAWNYLAMRESGWNQFARNPSSGAYGIAQALPPTKYPFAGQAAGGSNPTAQIRWMAAYISGRYGDPIRAAQHEAAFNWYDQGGYLPVGASIALNTTSAPEAVVPGKHLEQMIALLDELCGLVATNNQITAAAPTATGAGLGAVLGAHARKATYRAMYS